MPRVSSSVTAKVPLLLVFVALVLSTAAKAIRLPDRELWLDETYSAYAASLPLDRLWHFSAGDVHPRLYSFTLWLWSHLAGSSPGALRLLSLLLSIASVLLMFALAQELLGRRAGALAACLWAFAPVLFIYSLEVRSYMLFLVVYLALLRVHWQVAVCRRQTAGHLLLYAALAAALFYTHYIAVLVLIALAAHWLALSSLRWSRLRPVVALALLTAALALPGARTLLYQHHLKHQIDLDLTQSHSAVNTLSSAPQLSASAARKIFALGAAKNLLFTAGFFSGSMLLFAVTALVLGLTLAGALVLWFRRSDPVCSFVGVVGTVLLVALLAGGFGNHRYFLALLPLIILGLVRSLQRWPFPGESRRLAPVLAALVLAVYLVGFGRQFLLPQDHPWQSVVSALQQRARPGDLVLFDALWGQVPFDFYARRQGLHVQETGFPLSVYDWWRQQPFQAWGGPVITRADLDRTAAVDAPTPSRTVWLVLFDSTDYDPHATLLARFAALGRAESIPLPPDLQTRDGEPPLIRLVRIAAPAASGAVTLPPQVN